MTDMMTLCESCDGRGHDDDILCPMPCDACRGTGLEPVFDEPHEPEDFDQ